MRQARLFEDALPERYQRIYADMERQGIIVPPTPPDYCDLCGMECDCLLLLDAPGHPKADPEGLINLCCECPESETFFNQRPPKDQEAC